MDIFKNGNQCNIYKYVFENARDIILLISGDGKILLANNKALEAYGYTNEELTNLYIHNLRDPGEGDKVNEQIKKALKEGITVETYHYRKDGSRFPVEVNSANMGSDVLVSIIRDITDRKNKEKEIRELAAIVESSHDAIIGRDINGIITSFNKGAEKIYGYTKEEAIGKDASYLISSDLKGDIVHIIEKIKKGESIRDYETIRKHKNGKIIHVSLSASAIMDDDFNIVGISTIGRDIAEKKEKEKELINKHEELLSVYQELTASEEELRNNYLILEKLKDEAEKANTAKSQFLANMSHEIRTPMNGIIGTADLLELTNLGQEQREYLDMLKTSSHNLLDIINNILDLSRIESHKIALNNSPFNLKDIIEKAVKQFRIAGQEKGIDIIYIIDPLLNRNLSGDSLRLIQILNNLLNNALKFTDEGHIVLSAISSWSENGRIKIQFSVQDSGIGISDEIKERIFDSFVQGDISYTKKYAGAGLGLAITKELVELMGGEVWVDSQVGKGSTFYFTAEFDIDSADADKSNNKDIQTKDNIYKQSCDTNAVVLSVEDSEINQGIIKAFLEGKGYKCLTAINGEEALLILGHEKVDLVLMDIQMPVKNGFETTLAIRDREAGSNAHIPIIAVTAYAMYGDKEKCLEAGMDDYISKPVDLNELNMKIQSLLQ